MNTSSERKLAFFAKTPTLIVFSIIWMFLCFLLSNYILAFIMGLLKFIRPILKGGEINLEKYHFPPINDIFIFQIEYWKFYLVLYLIALIGLVKFCYNMVINYRDLNKGQYGTSEFEDPANLPKQYKVIPGSKKEYEGESGAIISAYRSKTGKYQLMIDTGPVHTMLIGITRSGKGETWVVPMIDVISRAKQKDSMVVNDPKGELAAASYDTLTNRGYEVHVFNLMNTEMSMSFNPLQLVIDSLKEDNPAVAEKYAYSVAFSLYDDP
ncbi:type IV secretory system conjugative DNA transfer family protein, partial [Heyndrickxia ginsengihumi]|uniref:type IV secretory system conjugative DNA transfer family protein n=1 Tax=Heyndrickxia ginsengihumi TaxID=363870 RepID=UPI000471A9FD